MLLFTAGSRAGAGGWPVGGHGPLPVVVPCTFLQVTLSLQSTVPKGGSNTFPILQDARPVQAPGLPELSVLRD